MQSVNYIFLSSFFTKVDIDIPLVVYFCQIIWYMYTVNVKCVQDGENEVNGI